MSLRPYCVMLAAIGGLAGPSPIASRAEAPEPTAAPASRPIDQAEPGAADSAESEHSPDLAAEPDRLADDPEADPFAVDAAPLLSLDRVDFGIEVAGEYEQRRVTTRAGPFLSETRQKNRWWRFEELAQLGLDAAVGGPDVFAFTGQFGLGWSQERFRETFNGALQDRDADGSLAEFDFRGDILSSGPLSATVSGLQSFDRYARPFLPSLRERRTEYGAGISLNDEKIPMEWRWQFRDADRDGDRRDLDNERVTSNLFQYDATWNHTERHTGRFNFEYEDRAERYSGLARRFDLQRYQLRYEDTLTFGDSNQHRLDSVIRYADEDGPFARDLFEAGPRLTLQHSPTLQSYYQYQYSQEQVGAFDVALNRFDVGVVHTAFENLVTTVNIFGLNETVTNDTESNELGATLDASYRRPNSLGEFAVDVGLTQESETVRGGGLRLQLRESAAFRDPLPVVLARAGVFAPTIVVWNTTRTRVYRPLADYFIVQRRGATLLTRNPFGRIRINESVSIDYVYSQDPDADRAATRADLRVQQTFANGLTPYYAMDFREEDRDRSIGTPRFENDLNRHRLGLRFQRPRYTLGGEFEVLHDNVDPFIAYRVFADGTLWQEGRATIGARSDLTHYFFERDGNRDVIVFENSLDGRVDWSIGSSGFARVTWRYEDDRSRGNVNAVDVESGAEMRYGPYTVTASVEYDLLDIVDSREDGLGVWLRVRRDLYSLPGADAE